MFGKRKMKRGSQPSQQTDSEFNASQSSLTMDSPAETSVFSSAGTSTHGQHIRNSNGSKSDLFVKTTQQSDSYARGEGGMDSSTRGHINTSDDIGITWGKGVRSERSSLHRRCLSRSQGKGDRTDCTNEEQAEQRTDEGESDCADRTRARQSHRSVSTGKGVRVDCTSSEPSASPASSSFHSPSSQESSRSLPSSVQPSAQVFMPLFPSQPTGEFTSEAFNAVIDVADVREHYRKLRRSVWRLRVVSVFLLILAACVIGYPFVLQYQSGQTLSSISDTSAATVAGWPYPEAENEFAAAQEYNEELFENGQSILGEASDPFSTDSGSSQASGDDSASENDEEYQELLDTGGGVMGTIVIPEISVELPIYHGTSETALASGSGHLYGTSLPVGGENTHSVITGHRGLVESLMFTRLDEMEIGDVFYIEVMGETLAYTVDRISVIEPTDISQLTIVEGEDRVTLMTCTPYGVNTHRLLVSGLRSEMPDEAPYLDDAPGDARTMGMITAGLILAAGWLLTAWIRRSPWQSMRHGALWPRHW